MPLLALVAQSLGPSDLGRLACCSRALRSGAYQAWPAHPAAAWLAARHGVARLLRLQLQAGVDPDRVALPDGDTLLMVAASNDHLEAVQVLLQAGAAINATHPVLQATALALAAWHGHLAVAQALLVAGAADRPGMRSWSVLAVAGRQHRRQHRHSRLRASVEYASSVVAVALLDVGAAAYWACVALGTAGVEGWAPVLAAAWHDRRVAAQVQSWLIPLFMLRHALLGR